MVVLLVGCVCALVCCCWNGYLVRLRMMLSRSLFSHYFFKHTRLQTYTLYAYFIDNAHFHGLWLSKEEIKVNVCSRVFIHRLKYQDNKSNAHTHSTPHQMTILFFSDDITLLRLLLPFYPVIFCKVTIFYSFIFRFVKEFLSIHPSCASSVYHNFSV